MAEKKKGAPKKLKKVAEGSAEQTTAVAAASAPPRARRTAPGGKKDVIRLMDETADKIYRSINNRRKPSLKFPIRSLKNVAYSPKKGFFEMKGLKKERTLTYNTVKTFAQALRMMALSKDAVQRNDIVTKREAYYVAKGWEEAKFDEQPESDAVIEDLEALFEVNREQLGFVPEEKGGEVSGNLVVIDQDEESGEVLNIDCSRFASGAYSIPISVEHLKFKTKAKFVLAVETAGMFARLNKHKFWRTSNCILISMGGVPTRACRRFIRRLADDQKLPVYVFVDCDPYGIGNIYRTLKVGSGNAAHINEFFCVPQAKFLGVTPQDIVDYKLPTHPLNEIDVKRAKDAMKNDPFFQHYKEWGKAMNQLIKMGVRAEQQAFATHSLNYVLETYLPEKLDHPEKFLP